MDNEDEPDIFTRAEDRAPNLGGLQYVDDPDYICCVEVPNVKRGPCLPSVDDKVRYECLLKQKTLPKPIPKKKKLENERDILFRPMKWRCKSQKARPEKPLEPSLGAPIGLSSSTFSMNFLETKPAELSLQGFATVLVGYAEYFITPEIEWDEKVLNRVLLEGQRLYNESHQSLPDGENFKESSIKRTFMLCNNAFHVMVNDPFLIGHVIGDEFPVPTLHWGLLKFFKKFQFCLLQIGSWYVLLWKNADVYFVFDCFGRRTEDFRSDRKRGIAVLVCLRSLDNVSHLLLNLSGVQSDQLFTIRHLQLKSLVPCGGKPTPDIVDRTNQYEVIHPDYAVLRASIHLGSNCFKEIRHRHSLPVAIAALINAKIDATPVWDRAVLDKVLKLGAQLYKQWTQCDMSLNLGIQDVPSKFIFGQFMVQIAVNAIDECGLWKCTPNFHHSDLSLALARAFERGGNLILQIQGRSYAIWKKGSFYFLLDPFSHQCSLGKAKLVTASVRMCGGFERLCCVVTQSLLDLFEESKFIIHLMKIIHLEELCMIKENRRRATAPCMCLATPQTDAVAEVVSVNDSVVGPQEYECAEEPPLFAPDSADLDSPGLSQTRLDDYTDLRRDLVAESDDDEDDDDDEGLDLDADDPDGDLGGGRKSDDGDDDGKEGRGDKQKKEKKDKKKSKEPVKKEKPEKAGGDASDADKRGKKRTLDKDNDKDKDKDLKRQKKDEGEAGGDDKAKEEQSKDDKSKDDKSKDDKSKDDKSKDDKANEEKAKKDKSKDDKSKDDKSKDDKSKDDKSKDDKSKGDRKSQLEPIPEPPKVDPKRESVKRESVKQPEVKDQDSGKESKTDQTSRDDARRSTNKGGQTVERRQRRQRRKEQDGDDTSSDEIPRCGIPAGCIPNAYPGFTEDPQDLAVVGSESGSYESLCCLLKSAFRCADRVLTMTPWGNYVAFHANRIYFVFDGCTCNLRSIRHLDLSVGTAGLLCFPDMHELICYIESGKDAPRPTTSTKRDIVDQICNEYCGR